MYRRGVLGLLCLVGGGGCLRLQEGQGETTAAGSDGAATADTDVGVTTADDSASESGVTLTERWSEELNLEKVWAEGSGFFLAGDERVARAFPSGMDWTNEIPGVDDNLATEAFALNDSRAVFGISPDEGETENPDRSAQYLAFNSASGERLWRYEMPKDGKHEYARGAALVGGVAVIGSHLYGSTSEYDPLVVGVDAETGAQMWETHLAEHGARYLSSMAVYDGAVYVGMAGSGIARVDASTGTVDQTFGSMSTLTVGGTVNGRSFYGAIGGTATAYSLDDGSTQWSGTLDDRTWVKPVVDNTLAVFGTGAGTVYAFERSSGEQRWTQPVNGRVNAITLTASHVWVADENNGLTAFARTDGTVRHRATQAVDDMAASGDSLLVGGDTTTLFTID